MITINAITETIGFIIFTLIFDLTFISYIILIILKIKKEKRIYINVKNKKIKIIEDKIYDKYFTKSLETKNNPEYFNFFISTKVYFDNIQIDRNTYNWSPFYDKCKKNDSIYFIFYSDNETVPKQYYLAKDYILSSELIPYFKSYDETIGENIFNQKINNKINELKTKKNKVNCKICNTKYNLFKEEMCPNCNKIYQFDITDVVKQKKWYKK